MIHALVTGTTNGEASGVASQQSFHPKIGGHELCADALERRLSRWGGRAVGLIPLVGLLAVLVLGACAIPGSQRREAEQVATARVRDLARLDRQDVERAANAGQLGAAEVAEILVRSGRAIVVQKSMDDTGAVALGYLDWGQAGGGFTGVTVYARLCVELTVSSGGESAMVDADCPERITAPPGGTLVRVRLD